MRIRRVATIPSLKSGITEEDILRAFGGSLSCPGVRIWIKQTQLRTRGEDRRGVDLEKGWNEGFDHARWMMTYD